MTLTLTWPWSYLLVSKEVGLKKLKIKYFIPLFFKFTQYQLILVFEINLRYEEDLPMCQKIGPLGKTSRGFVSTDRQTQSKTESTRRQSFYYSIDAILNPWT